ncbi:hypothetical protein GGS24DRAFT_180257 [Hypoxylon argillaceum]|nr:hypothetical protein GGS24DRAFT_180257 [Hypoxylon argillaceum]
MKLPTDFIGSALGESENITKTILDATQGKVLSINEPYSLSELPDELNTTTSKSLFKTSLISTVVAVAQGTVNIDRCILLLSYMGRIEAVLQSVNPSLGRRFPLLSAFDVQGYSRDKMRQIVSLGLAESGFITSDSAKKTSPMRVLDQTRNRRNYGNGGEVDRLLDRAKMQ